MSFQKPVAAAAFAVVLVSGGMIAAQQADDRQDEADDELVQERLELMREHVLRFRSRAEDPEIPERFQPEPIFRYADPARAYVAAALWRLGAEGRPRAIISTELHREFFGRPRIVFEYLATGDEPFSLTSGTRTWNPPGSALEFRPVPEAPAPAATPERRLIQMRNIARRFEANETLQGETYVLRLLASPVVRYEPEDAERADGAVFLYVYGTNPEVALFIESDGQAWTYAAGRLSSAPDLSLSFGGETAWQAPPVVYKWNQPYTASNLPADIPGVEP